MRNKRKDLERRSVQLEKSIVSTLWTQITELSNYIHVHIVILNVIAENDGMSKVNHRLALYISVLY